MLAIFGLGNPGKKYEYTRHNAGFCTIDYIADRHGIKINKIGYNALYGEGNINGEKVLLVKPQSFMNLSGKCVSGIMNFYKLENTDILVIYDDVSMPVGQLRVRTKGSAGGHNGIKDIILSINSDVFPRIKMGVGAPQHPEMDLADYVLGKFTEKDMKLMGQAAEKIEENIQLAIKRDYNALMSKLNVKIGEL
ncbi:MAG: aminoacyl-tRNA hydrolase [Clostridia bacterium]|nr:aminoacyl-tRNA hydrolase [Clostridia bacterium]